MSCSKKKLHTILELFTETSYIIENFPIRLYMFEQRNLEIFLIFFLLLLLLLLRLCCCIVVVLIVLSFQLLLKRCCCFPVIVVVDVVVNSICCRSCLSVRFYCCPFTVFFVFVVAEV